MGGEGKKVYIYVTKGSREVKEVCWEVDLEIQWTPVSLIFSLLLFFFSSSFRAFFNRPSVRA